MRAAAVAVLAFASAVVAGPSVSPAPRSTLARRYADMWGGSCSSASDCWPDAHGDTTCDDGQCNTVCNPGYDFRSGYCHMTKPNCPPGQYEFMGFCVTGPAEPPLPLVACTTTNDCNPTTVSNAYDACEMNVCTIRCMTGYNWDGRTCAKTPFTCNLDKDCAPGTLESRLLGKCSDLKKCYAACEPGYVRSALRCVVPPQQCKSDNECKPCALGSSTCNQSQCSYKCHDSTHTMSCDANGCKCSPPPKKLSVCGPQNPCANGQSCYNGICKSNGPGPSPPNGPGPSPPSGPRGPSPPSGPSPPGPGH